MSTASSSSSEVDAVQGEVNGKTATLKYDSSSKVFAYNIEADGAQKDIPATHIIAILRSAGDEPAEYNLLYVDVTDDNSDTPVEKRTGFQSLTLTSPPAGLLQDYPVSGSIHYRIELERTGHILNPNDPIDVVLSSHSGSRHAQTIYDNLLLPCRAFLQVDPSQKWCDWNLVETRDADSITSWASTCLGRANKGTSQYGVLLTGDGGIVETINGLLSKPQSKHYTKPTIAILPSGTGNAIANSYGILNDATFGMSTLLRGKPRELPLFKVSFPPGTEVLDTHGNPTPLDGAQDVHGAVVFSWGLHASLVADSDTPEYRKHGAERFRMAAMENLFPPDGSKAHAYAGKVSLLTRPSDVGEGTWCEIERDTHSYILVTLVQQLEKGFTISPDSQPFDGKLRVVHFGDLPEGGKDAMTIMEQAYAGGKHVGNEHVGYEEIEGMEIELKEEDAKWRRLCVDGKIFRLPKDGTVSLTKETKGVIDLVSLEA